MSENAIPALEAALGENATPSPEPKPQGEASTPTPSQGEPVENSPENNAIPETPLNSGEKSTNEKPVETSTPKPAYSDNEPQTRTETTSGASNEETQGEEAKPTDKPKGKERKPKTGKQAKLMKLFAELLAHIEAKTGVKIVRETDEQIRKSAEQAQSGKFKAGTWRIANAADYGRLASQVSTYWDSRQELDAYYFDGAAFICKKLDQFGEFEILDVFSVEVDEAEFEQRREAVAKRMAKQDSRDYRRFARELRNELGFDFGGSARAENGATTSDVRTRARRLSGNEKAASDARRSDDGDVVYTPNGEIFAYRVGGSLKFRQGGYMDGGAWSYRANEALNRGLRPAAMIAKDLGASIEAVEDVLRSNEWHHVGEDFEEVYFYDTDDVAVETTDAILDADDARRFKNVVQIKNWETRPEPRKPGRFSRESSDEHYATFVHTRTRADKQAYDAEDAFDKAIEAYENGDLDLAGLQKAAEQFEKDYAAGIKAKKEAVKSFLAKHKDWKRPSKRRAKIGTNGLRYLSRDGVVYGYFDPVRKELHLNEDFADFDTPIHEWTHVWWSWVSEQDSRLTDKIVDLVKRTEAFAKLKAEAENPESVYHGLDDAALAQEVFSRLVGERGEEFITKSEKSLWAKLKEYAQAFFKTVLRTLGLSDAQVESLTLEDVQNMALRDLFSDEKFSSELAQTEKPSLSAEETRERMAQLREKVAKKIGPHVHYPEAVSSADIYNWGRELGLTLSDEQCKAVLFGALFGRGARAINALRKNGARGEDFFKAIVDSVYAISVVRTESDYDIVGTLVEAASYWNKLKTSTILHDDALSADGIELQNILLNFADGTPDTLKTYIGALGALEMFRNEHDEKDASWWDGTIADDVPFVASAIGFYTRFPSEVNVADSVLGMIRDIAKGDKESLIALQSLLAERHRAYDKTGTFDFDGTGTAAVVDKMSTVDSSGATATADEAATESDLPASPGFAEAESAFWDDVEAGKVQAVDARTGNPTTLESLRGKPNSLRFVYNERGDYSSYEFGDLRGNGAWYAFQRKKRFGGGEDMLYGVSTLDYAFAKWHEARVKAEKPAETTQEAKPSVESPYSNPELMDKVQEFASRFGNDERRNKSGWTDTDWGKAYFGEIKALAGEILATPNGFVDLGELEARTSDEEIEDVLNRIRIAAGNIKQEKVVSLFEKTFGRKPRKQTRETEKQKKLMHSTREFGIEHEIDSLTDANLIDVATASTNVEQTTSSGVSAWRVGYLSGAGFVLKDAKQLQFIRDAKAAIASLAEKPAEAASVPVSATQDAIAGAAEDLKRTDSAEVKQRELSEKEAKNRISEKFFKRAVLPFVFKSKDPKERPVLQGVLYEGGFITATNAKVLARVRVPYDAEYEGKIIIAKTGEEYSPPPNFPAAGYPKVSNLLQLPDDAEFHRIAPEVADNAVNELKRIEKPADKEIKQFARISVGGREVFISTEHFVVLSGFARETGSFDITIKGKENPSFHFVNRETGDHALTNALTALRGSKSEVALEFNADTGEVKIPDGVKVKGEKLSADKEREAFYKNVIYPHMGRAKNDHWDTKNRVYYKDGFVYATNARSVVKVAFAYPESLEGKVVEFKTNKEIVDKTSNRAPFPISILKSLEIDGNLPKAILDVDAVAKAVESVKSTDYDSAVSLKVGDKELFFRAKLLKDVLRSVQHFGGEFDVVFDEKNQAHFISDDMHIAFAPIKQAKGDTIIASFEFEQKQNAIFNEKGEVKGAVSSENRIENFGEEVVGNRDMWGAYRKTLGNITKEQLQAKSLSEVFPRPNARALAKSGNVSADVAALVLHIYNQIPPKGRYSENYWLKSVFEASSMIQMLLESKELGDEYIAKLRETAQKTENYRGYEVKTSEAMGAEAMLLYVDTLKALGFPEADVKLGKKSITVSHYTNHDEGKQYSSYTIRNGKRRVKSFGSFEEAVDALRDMVESGKGKSRGEAKIEFILLRYRATGERFIAVGKPSRYHKLKGGFNDWDSARAYLEENRAALEELYRRIKDVPSERNAENAERVGADWRKGKDVSEAQFSETFGFRGIRFGKWVEQDKRQENLNEAFDSLMDLADLLGVNPKALSLNGELALAFGALGHSDASAHYELNNKVINLTKKHGAGSLAHEWWHALDNYFGAMSGSGMSMITEAEKFSEDKIRKEVAEVFFAVRDAIANSNLAKRSEALDKLSTGKPYWGEITEMTARSFEAWVKNEIDRDGRSNDFLANITSHESWLRSRPETEGERLDDYPYPLPSEMESFGTLFRALADTIEERTGENGSVALYQMPTTEAMTISEGDQRLLAAHVGGFVPGATIQIVDDVETAAGEAALKALEQSAEYKEAKAIYEAAMPKVIARTNAEANAELKKIQGEPIKNKETGIEAVVANTGRGKLLSNKAADKSIANGFTREQHNTAAANIKDLFERGKLFYEGSDKNAEKEVKSIKRFASLFAIDGVLAEADILVKETEQGGNRIYTVELQEIKTPSERGTESINGGPVIEPHHTSDGRERVAEEAAKVKAVALKWKGLRYQRALHGSPHRFAEEEGAPFGRFRDDKMGTGEGAQAFGWGHYLTSREGIAREYAENLAEEGDFTTEFILKKLKENDILDGVLGRIKMPKYKAHDFVLSFLSVWNGDKKSVKWSVNYVADRKRTFAMTETYDAQKSFENAKYHHERKPNSTKRKEEYERAKKRLEDAKAAYDFYKSDINPEEIFSEEFTQTVSKMKQPRRHLYTAEFDDAGLLDWVKPLTAEQQLRVAEQLREEGLEEEADALADDAKHGTLYTAKELHENDGVLGLNSPKERSKLLLRAGFVGHKFPAQSMGAGDYSKGTNYVIYDESALNIVDRVSWMRDLQGVFGAYVPATKQVFVAKNSRIDTLLHELGWHATFHWAGNNAPELYALMKRYAEEAPAELKAKVAEVYGYGDGKISDEEFLDECGAALLNIDDVVVFFPVFAAGTGRGARRRLLDARVRIEADMIFENTAEKRLALDAEKSANEQRRQACKHGSEHCRTEAVNDETASRQKACEGENTGVDEPQCEDKSAAKQQERAEKRSGIKQTRSRSAQSESRQQKRNGERNHHRTQKCVEEADKKCDNEQREKIAVLNVRGTEYPCGKKHAERDN